MYQPFPHTAPHTFNPGEWAGFSAVKNGFPPQPKGNQSLKWQARSTGFNTCHKLGGYN